MDASRTTRHTLIATLVLVATVFGLYLPALDYDFVWDDRLYVVQNEAVQDWSRAGEAFTSPATTWTANAEYYQVAWRPLRNISFLIDYSLFELDPIGWHLHNILLHAAGAVLLFFLLRRLWRLFGMVGGIHEVPGLAVTGCCFAGALFWAVHPVQTEVVAWVKSRDDLLATPLFFGALLLALPRRADSNRASTLSLVFGVLVYIAAVLSKENVVVLAAILPLLLLGRAFCWFGLDQEGYCGSTTAEYLNAAEELRIERKRRRRAALWVSGIFIVVTLGLLVARHLLLGRTSQAAYPGSFSQTLLTMAAAFTQYVRLVLWPWLPTVQMADYDGFRVVSSWLHPLSLAGFVILLMIIIVADSTRYRAPLISLGILFFLIGMLPFSNVVPMMQIMAERFLYLSLAGVSLVVTGVLLAARPFSARSAVVWLAGVVLLALAAQTWVRLPVWQSEVALFEANRAANPDSWRPADLYVGALLKDNQTSAALVAARENLAKWPNDPDIVRTAALAHLMAGEETRGVELTDYAVRLQPSDRRAVETYRQWRRLQRTDAVVETE